MEAAELRTPAVPLSVPAAETRQHLGILLVRDGLLTAAQLEEALAEKEATGRRLGEIVVARGGVSPADLARALAEQHALQYLDLAKIDIETAATSLLPEKFAKRYQALPIKFEDEETVLVAVADPTNVMTSDDLRLALGLNVRFAVVAAPDLTSTIARLYRTHLELQDDSEPEPDAVEEGAVEDVRDGA